MEARKESEHGIKSLILSLIFIMADLNQAGFSYLWRKVSPYESKKVLFKALKVILDRLENGFDPGVILPETIIGICQLLADGQCPAHIKATICAMLQRLCSDGGNAGAFAKPELLTALHINLKKVAESGEALSDVDMILLEEVTGALQVMTYHAKISHAHLLSQGLVSHVCSLGQPGCQTTYRHGDKSRELFHQMTAGKFPGLVGRAKVMDKEEVQKQCEMCYGHKNMDLAVTGWNVSLYDTSEDKDIQIHEELLRERLAWPSMSEVDDSGDQENKLFDVYVTSVVDGGHFWALLHGGDSFERVARIKSIIEHFSDKSVLLKPPAEDSQVAGYDDTIGHFRGRVVKVVDDIIHVFAVDYGCILEIAWKEGSLFLITDEMGLHHFPSQASFCCLQGVSPPPVSIKVLQHLQGILTNLCVSADKYVDYFDSPEMIGILRYFCLSPVPALVKLAAEGISNLARSDLFRFKLFGYNTVGMLIDVCQKYMLQLHVDEITRATLGVLAAMANLIFKCPENQEVFHKCQGPRMMAKLTCETVPPQIQEMAKRVLSTYIGATDPIDIVIKGKKGHRLPIRNSDVLAELKLGISALGITEETRGRPHVRSRSKSKEARPRSRTSDKSRSPSSQERKEAGLMPEQLEESDSEAEELFNLLESDREEHSKSPKGTVRVMPASAVYHQLHSQDAYIQGLKVKFKNDATHDFRPDLKIENISTGQILRSVCGMLNSGKPGSIYLGLQPNRAVHGIRINRHQRDEFRMGIDILTRQFQPQLMHSMLKVAYHQVVQCSAAQHGYDPIENLYVIEIQLWPAKGTVYYIGDMEIYFRNESETHQVMLPDLHRQCIEKEEESHLLEIASLHAELSRLQGSQSS